MLLGHAEEEVSSWKNVLGIIVTWTWKPSQGMWPWHGPAHTLPLLPCDVFTTLPLSFFSGNLHNFGALNKQTNKQVKLFLLVLHFINILNDPNHQIITLLFFFCFLVVLAELSRKEGEWKRVLSSASWFSFFSHAFLSLFLHSVFLFSSFSHWFWSVFSNGIFLAVTDFLFPIMQMDLCMILQLTLRYFIW